MKTLTIIAFDRDSSGFVGLEIQFSGKTKEQLIKERDEFLESVTFRKWYYEVESNDKFTKKEQALLEELAMDML